jgi:hypothetical protein
MVGTVAMVKLRLVKASDGTTYRVQVGNYMAKSWENHTHTDEN